MTDEERIERLEMALLELVSWRDKYTDENGWHKSLYGDANVDDIIGDLLDKYKPKDINPRP